VTDAAAKLLADAERAQAACDLLASPSERAAEVEALIEIFLGEALASASERALFNLLWIAGELSAELDLYRAASLSAALERLFTGCLSRLAPDDARAGAAEMAWDFVFNRVSPPLASARAGEVIDSLARVLASGSRVCARAALHGLGHLRPHALDADRARIDALLDGVDASLAEYAAEAKSGTLL
jgi:hypothetical protein